MVSVSTATSPGASTPAGKSSSWRWTAISLGCLGRSPRESKGFGSPMSEDALPESWRAALEPALQSREARRLGGFLKAEESAGKTIYPPRGQRLAALATTPLDQVKVVILGQDPYHGPGQAH